MRGKHRKTLARVLSTPTPADLWWKDIEAMLGACGVEVVERSGSRVGLMKDGERIVVHRPHPGPVVGRATLRDIAAFLRAAELAP